MPKDVFDRAMDAVECAMDGVGRAMDGVGDAMDRVGDALHGKGVTETTKVRVRLTPELISKLLAGKPLTFTVADLEITIEKTNG